MNNTINANLFFEIVKNENKFCDILYNILRNLEKPHQLLGEVRFEEDGPPSLDFNSDGKFVTVGFNLDNDLFILYNKLGKVTQEHIPYDDICHPLNIKKVSDIINSTFLTP